MKLPELHPIDAEARFTDSFQRLKKEIADHPNCNERVGAFWDAEWHRAPFEEELTLKQIASLSVDTLIKKKSFTTEKMIALAIALERGLDQKPLSSPSTQAPVHANLKPSFTPKNTPIIPPSLHGEELFYWYGMQAASQAIFTEAPLSLVIQTILTTIELISWKQWITNPLTFTHTQNTLISECVSNVAPEVFIHWRTALSGAGASVETLVKPYTQLHIETELTETLLRPIITSLGAIPVMIGKIVIPSHYTLHSGSAAAIINGLKGRKVSNQQQFIERFSLPLPFFDLTIVFESIQKKTKSTLSKSGC